MPPKARVLLVGAGGIGTIAAVNLERGGLAEVICVLRSNYEAVVSRGIEIRSCEHGHIESWRPTAGLRSSFYKRHVTADGAFQS
jgi:ketopantoate reductase